MQQWNIGVIQAPISEILKRDFESFEIAWLPNLPKSRFWADPFGFSIQGRNYLIFEDYSYFLKRGRIALAELTSNCELINFRILLDSIHLSYPYVISIESQRVYFCAESHKARSLPLFKIEFDETGDFQGVSKVRDLSPRSSLGAVVDPSLFFADDKWWMFYTKAGPTANSELRIAYADSLLEEFIEHRTNPVKAEPLVVRPAGTLFVSRGKIYRPAQNCTNTYGGSVLIHRITELTQENFKEELVREIKPQRNCSYPLGIHTISQLGKPNVGRREEGNIRDL